MKYRIVTKEEYEKVLIENHYKFNSVEFHNTVQDKVDTQFYLLFKESKYVAGIIFGLRDHKLFCPYSAPFGIVESVKNSLHLINIYDILEEIEDFAKSIYCREIFFRLPPIFYDELYISKFANALVEKQYHLKNMDLNYHIYIPDNMEKYKESLARNARKNLSIALEGDLQLIHCKSEENRKLAYDVIKENRKSRGFPLRMTWEQVNKTIEIINSDMFFVKHKDENLAAALVYYVTRDVVQVVYWGDIQGHNELKLVNYLSYQLVDYYRKKNIRVLDIGPSTEDGVPNFGLCDFKESIGCSACPKFTFYKMLE